MLRRGESGRELRNIQGFREWRRGAFDAGRFEPAWDAGRATHGRGWRLMIFCARATRTLRRCSLDARTRRPSRPPSREGKTSKLGGIYFLKGRWSLNAHTRKGRREQPGALSCSRNPHDEAVVVRRAQKREAWLLPCGGDGQPKVSISGNV